MMIQMLKQKGAGYSTDDGEILIFNDETEDILYELAGHTKTGAFSTFKISSYPGNYLNAGQCIFAIDSTAGATWMGPEAPQIDIAEENLIDCEIAVRAIPQYDTADPQMISQGPSICIFNKENSKEVMASWIFVQYLLTNEVQIAYSQTEGYLPVTSKAHSSPEYQSYLSKSGEDNDLYYHVKIDAAKLLLNNLDNTFITPVFNGSASLRNAAGQMIEEVVKSIRRKQTVDDKYMKDLYERVSTLYHLDELNMKSGVKINFGALPKGSLALITVIGTVWVAIGAYYVVKLIKKHKNTE
jgi:multiple sugar transport system substrate-binding protein